MVSFRSRFLRAFLLAALLPAFLFWLLVDGEIRQLREHAIHASTAQMYTTLREQTRTVAAENAEHASDRLRFFGEAIKDLAGECERVLNHVAANPAAQIPSADMSGFIYSRQPEDGTVAFIARGGNASVHARSLYQRSRLLAGTFNDALKQIPELSSVSMLTRTGLFRAAPWFDPTNPLVLTGHSRVQSMDIGSQHHWPDHLAPGDPTGAPSWTDPYIEAIENNQWIVSVLYPVRDPAGNLFAEVAFDIPVERLLTLTAPAEKGFLTGILTRHGNPLAAWPMDAPFFLALERQAETGRLPESLLKGRRDNVTLSLADDRYDVFTQPIAGTSWTAITAFPSEIVQSRETAAIFTADTLGWRKARLLALAAFVLLVAIAVTGLLQTSRRLVRPFRQLSAAADAVRKGRPELVPALLPRKPKTTEIAWLSQSFEAMATGVERRVAALSGLSQLHRNAGVTLDMPEAQYRIVQILRETLPAKGGWVDIYSSQGRRLATPAKTTAAGAVAETAPAAHSLEGDSLLSDVSRSGKPYYCEDVAGDASARAVFNGGQLPSNAAFLPLRIDEESVGVLVVFGSPRGFGTAEREVLTAYADASAVLLRRVLLYERLEKTVTELRHANYLKEHFLQNVTHELRTPLTAILGWSEILEDSGNTPELLESAIRQIRQSSNTLLMLIDDLLDLSRLERGGFVLEQGQVHALEILAAPLEALTPQATAREIQLSGPPPESPDIIFTGDRLRLQQVVWNLINNSLKFTPRGGSVRVHAEAQDHSVRFVVEDTGKGIAPADLSHVFERFRQLDSSVTRRQPGMGIGLSIAKTIVELHGGRIWAQSELGRGSAFYFEIPFSSPSNKGV